MLSLELVEDVARLVAVFTGFDAQSVEPVPLFQPTLIYDSENTRQCSCSAAMRLGTNCTGTTIFARTGRADDVLGLGLLDFLLGERHHLAEGEREVERACARSSRSSRRCAAHRPPASSAGTIVKLICFGAVSAMRQDV